MDFLSLVSFFLNSPPFFCRSTVLDWPLQGNITQLTSIKSCLSHFIFPDILSNLQSWNTGLIVFVFIKCVNSGQSNILSFFKIEKDLTSSKSSKDFMTTFKLSKY